LCPGWPGPLSSHFRFPDKTGMTGEHHYTQLFLIDRRSHKLFCQGLLRSTILLISASQVAGIIMHATRAELFYTFFILCFCLKVNQNERLYSD
jgi:hypothetical protein